MMTVLVTPAYAFEDRTGDYVSIESNEVIDDDLYVTAQVFTMDGKITGDLVVIAQTITINGEVGGDLIAAGQTIIINGIVNDDVRIAGAGLLVGSQAAIGDDLVAAGASLETKDNSVISGELVVGSGQAVLTGDVTGDVLVGTGGLELNGGFDGDVSAYVGETDQSAPPMGMYMSNSPITLPNVRPGLKISDQASINGNLIYTSSTELSIPTGVVSGKITRTEPKYESSTNGGTVVSPPEKHPLVDWSLNLLRRFVTLLLFGLLIVTLAPNVLGSFTENIRTKFGSSLGWGLVAYAAFFFAILLVLVVTIIGGVVFGFFSLGSLTATIIFVGLLIIFALVLGFILIASFLTKIMVGNAIGKWIFGLAKSTLADNKYWSMIVGVLLITLAVSIPFIGWLFGLVVLFLGLGAFWLWGRETLERRQVHS
jgi:hypothetical protein